MGIPAQANRDTVLVAIHTKGHHTIPKVVIQVGVAWLRLRNVANVPRGPNAVKWRFAIH